MSDFPHSEQRSVPLAGLLEAVREAMLREFEQELAEAGYGDIRPTHGCVFRFVQEEGLRLTDLACRAGITKQSAGEIVDGLVELAYVERIPDPADRRAKLIRLTEKGREAQRFGFDLFGQVEARWAERFGVDRIGGMRETLEEIASREAPEAVPELAQQRESAAA
jgi:DNA-binding MarR family transcriptional regulator